MGLTSLDATGGRRFVPTRGITRPGLSGETRVQYVAAMVIGHAILALALAAIAVAILTFGLRVGTAHRSSWALLVVVFLLTWAGGVWLEPFGPPIGKVYWLPFTLIAILVAILLAAVLPPRVHTHAQVVEREHEVEVGLGVFFWTLVAALAAIVVLGYFR